MSPIDKTYRAHADREVIRVDGLIHAYGQKLAVNDVSFEVARGSLTALLGRNGSGKSTTIRAILGLLRPSGGSVRVFGREAHLLRPEDRARIGYMAENHPLYPWMDARDARDLQRGTFPVFRDGLYRAVLDFFRIAQTTKVRELSRGQRAGLCLALTLATEPELLVLDDPALGLDPIARQALLEALVFCMRDRKTTALLSSHLLSDVERLADRMLVIDRGVLRVSSTVDGFTDRVRRYALRFDREAPPPPVSRRVLTSSRRGAEMEITLLASDELPDELRGLGYRSCTRVPLGFEQALVAYLGSETSLVDALRGAA